MSGNVVVIVNEGSCEVKMRLVNPLVKSDGSVWSGTGNAIPVLSYAGAEKEGLSKSDLQKFTAARNWQAIPAAVFVKMGVNANGLEAIPEATLHERQRAYYSSPEYLAEKAEQEARERRQIQVHLSSRGWGDFTPVVWSGDRDQPTEEIVRECQRLLREGYDVDIPNQSDEAVTKKVVEAKQASVEQEEARQKDVEHLSSVQVPEAAVRAYVACSGDPEKLPDGIDNPGYWLVREYARAIEHQGLAASASVAKFAAEFREAARERAFEEGDDEGGVRL